MKQRVRGFSLIEVSMAIALIVCLSVICFEERTGHLAEAREVMAEKRAAKILSAKALFWFENGGAKPQPDNVAERAYLVSREEKNCEKE